MIIYLTRHGQPALENMPKGADYELPDGDYVLTPQGREQARCLGECLKQKNFSGKIFSSPYARTMETASIVAGICGLDVTPEPAIQEMRFDPELPIPGMTLEELRQNYPNISSQAELAHPWLVPHGPESKEDVALRVEPFLKKLIADPPAPEVLLVGHGASVGATKRFMLARAEFSGTVGITWNAALSTFKISPGGNIEIIKFDDVEFMPVEIITSNKRLYTDPE